jgi:hypothetical protein
MSGNGGRNRRSSRESSEDFQDALDMQLSQDRRSPSGFSTGDTPPGAFGGNSRAGAGGILGRGSGSGRGSGPGRGFAPMTPSRPSRGVEPSSGRFVGTPAGPPGLRQLPGSGSRIPVPGSGNAGPRYVVL